jgi:hypothetical protein
MIPQAHFGTAEDKVVNWREIEDVSLDDDEELDETPIDVVKMLGFDPKEFNKEE